MFKERINVLYKIKQISPKSVKVSYKFCSFISLIKKHKIKKKENDNSALTFNMSHSGRL
jgi:hypothetical protein